MISKPFGRLVTYPFQKSVGEVVIPDFPIANLVAYWKLDEETGTRFDAHTGGHDLTDTNGVGFESGVINNAATFLSASTQYLTRADDGTFDFERADPFSISCWFKTTDTGGVIFGKRQNSAPFRGYSVVIESTYIKLVLVNDNSPAWFIDVRSSGVTVNDGTWRHAVLTYDGSSAASGVTIYLNGALASMTTASDTLGARTILTNAPINIGSRGNGGVLLDGSIDEVGVWDIELTAQNALNLYNGGAALPLP